MIPGMRDDLPYAATLEVRDRCLCLHVQRAARALARRFDEALRPFGLTNGQFSLLMSLNRPEPPRISDLVELLAMDRTTLTAALKPLTRRGLVEVRRDEKDARSRRLLLSAEGEAVLAQALPVWRTTHEEVDALLASPDKVEDLRRDLNAISRTGAESA